MSTKPDRVAGLLYCKRKRRAVLSCGIQVAVADTDYLQQRQAMAVKARFFMP